LPIFGSIVEDFARWCLGRGFSVKTISMQLDSLRRLVPWFRRRGKRSIKDVTADDIAEARSFYRRRKWWLAAGMRELGDLLRGQGRLKPGRPLAPPTRPEAELARYAAHLHKDCRLAESTIQRHCFCVRWFLKVLRANPGDAAFRELEIGQIDSFLRRVAHHYSRRTMPLVVGTLRKFLRFEFTQGVLREPLHLRLESVRIYREEQLPHPLPWSELQKLLRIMDRSTPQRLRDFTMLLLAASYGLRRSEVAALTLDHIDWRARILRLPQPKTGNVLTLPLTDEVANALVDYLQRGRPATTDRHLFFRGRPPAGPLGAKGLAKCLRRAVRATGVKIETTSFHALRHAFALRLLTEGTALKHISEVLGHRSFNTTSAYLRLDVEDLRQVALAVPKPVKIHRSAGPACGLACSGRRSRRSGPVTAPASKGFRSFLARPMREFLALHRALGRKYHGQEWVLRNLDFFLAQHHVTARFFTAGMFEGWVADQAAVSPTVRSHWMRFVRKFCLYLARTVPKTFIPDPRTFPKEQPYQAPCLISERDVARLLAATHRPKPLRTPEHPLRPKTMRIAVLLLYCCGLRRAELLGLRLKDIDTERHLLRIDQSKFNKTRLVPLSPTVSNELQRYLQLRRDYQTPMDPSAPLLWSGRPNRLAGALSPTGLRFNWQQICRYAGVLNHRGYPPRLHDLRHSFAIAVLQRTYDAGKDPQATLPRLARYLGHVAFQFTHHYLQFTEPLRHAADARFRRSFAHLFAAPVASKSTKGGAR
jgi:site-specific recombinase XerD